MIDALTEPGKRLEICQYGAEWWRTQRLKEIAVLSTS